MTLCVYHIDHAAVTAREPRPGWYIADGGDPVAGPFQDKDTARQAVEYLVACELDERGEA